MLFKLLCDNRLEFKLYAFEVAYLVVFVKFVSLEIYEKLVSDILLLRRKSNEELKFLFNENGHAYVNSSYEWDYYVSYLLNDAKVLIKESGDTVCVLKHGTTSSRKVTRNKVTISPEVFNLVKKLETENSFLDKPLALDDPERLKIDVIKEIYSFYPRVLLAEIGEVENELKLELLNLPKLIDQYSNNTDGIEAFLFEDVLVDGFNLFYNVEAKKIGGAGNTDLECLYLTTKKKFAVDAKSTKNKLSGINSGRLADHRNKIGGVYTIVVTPRYVPAVLLDIRETPIVIIRASTFSEYLYNCIDNNIRDIDFEDFDNIIICNLGSDVSKLISDLTIDRFATKNNLI